MKKIIKNKYSPYIIMVLLAIFICIPLFTMNLYLHNEAILHMVRIFAVDEILDAGVFPPIISYKFMEGFGYAVNLFYGPLTTYIPIIFLNIFGTSGMAFKVFTLLTVILSSITMYRFTYLVTKRRIISLITSLIYISMPYKLSDIYARNAIGEYTAFVFIPLVFEGIYKILNTNKKSYALALGIIGLVLSHTISTIYIAIFSAIYVLMNFKKLKDITVWKRAGTNILIAVLVCAFYVIPILEHNASTTYLLMSKEDFGSTGEDVAEASLSISDLLANEAGTQEIRFSIGLVTIVLTALTIVCFKKIDNKYKNIYLQFGILAVITLILSTNIFPWKFMPHFLTVIQFAWRNLGFFAFFIALISGINAVTFVEKVVKKENIKETFIFGVIFSIFVFTGVGTLRDWHFDNVSEESELDKSLSNESIYALKINRDYLPKKAYKNLKYLMDRENKTLILEGNANITHEEKEKLQDKISLENIEENTVLELPYLYYMGYNIEVRYDEQEYNKIKYEESDNGFMQIRLKEAENIEVKIEYRGTVIEKLGYVISVVGTILLILVIVKNRGKEVERKVKEV